MTSPKNSTLSLSKEGDSTFPSLSLNRDTLLTPLPMSELSMNKQRQNFSTSWDPFHSIQRLPSREAEAVGGSLNGTPRTPKGRESLLKTSEDVLQMYATQRGKSELKVVRMNPTLGKIYSPYDLNAFEKKELVRLSSGLFNFE